MTYKAPLTLADDLANLREKYLALPGVSADADPYAISKLFGAKDVQARLKQISLLEAFAKSINPAQVSGDKAIYLEKVKILVAIAHLTSQDINSYYHSDLQTLINKALDIADDNPLDPLSLRECLMALKSARMDVINESLTALKLPTFSRVAWSDLMERADREQLAQKRLSQDGSILAKTVGTASGFIFGAAAWGVGFAFGQTLGRAGTFAPVKTAMRAMISTSFIMLAPIVGTTGGAAATLLAYPHAEEAINTGVGYGAAQLCAKGGRYVGYNLGYLIGGIGDKAWQFTKDATVFTYNKIVGEQVNVDIKLGIDILQGELTARTQEISQAEFERLLQDVIEEHVEAQKKLDKGESDIIQPRVIRLSISDAERVLLPSVMKTMGLHATSEPELTKEEAEEDTHKIASTTPAI